MRARVCRLLVICLIVASSMLTRAAAVDGQTIRRLPPVSSDAPAPIPMPMLTPAFGSPPEAVLLTAHQLAAYQPAAHQAYEQPWVGFEGDPAEPRYEVGARFDRGLFIRGTDLEEDPYAMYIGGRLQLRYIGFTRDVETFTDNAGVTSPVNNRNQFDTERVRLNISGTALSPDLTYYFIYDADGDGGSLTDGLAYIFTYKVGPGLKVRAGRWKAAAHRQWLLSSRYLRFSDRSLATEFFRVGFSDGLWLLGDLDGPAGGRWHYETSLTNGLRTSTKQASALDDNLGIAATLYCDPVGAYGLGNPDYLWHETPVVRFGGSFAYEKTDDRSDVGPAFALGDAAFVRLTDGTPIASVGALAPGVSLLGDRLLLAAIDVGVKYRGWSACVEYFIRSLQDFTATGPIPDNKLYAYGFHAELGKFLIKKRLDVNFRMSQISGLFGNAFEYSGGLNYYFGDGGPDGNDQVNKFSFDVSNIIQSSADSSVIDVFAGDDGVLFRAQVQIGF